MTIKHIEEHMHEENNIAPFVQAIQNRQKKE